MTKPDPTAVTPPCSCPAIRVVMLPRDTNAQGTIFGGVILSYIDQAGFVEASRQSARRYVTVSMDRVEFREPVFVGDIVSFHAETIRIGRTSIRVRVDAFAQRFGQAGSDVLVTEAEVTYVAIDDHRRPMPVMDDPEKQE